MKARLLTAMLLGTMLTTPAWAAIDPTRYGLNQGAADNSEALQRAFDEARRTGDSVSIPAGTFRYSQQLRIDGVRVSGQGDSTVLAPQVPTQQRVLLTGQSPALENMRFAYRDIVRQGSDHGRKGVMVQDATGFTLRGLTLDGAAYGTPQYGGGPIFVYRSTNGTVANNRLSYTHADAIHITGGSQNIDVTGNRVDHSHDDGIAVVNYGDGAGNVRINGNTVLENRWGRNITAVGASNVQITDNYIKGNSADGAGVYIASEPRYNTAAPRNVVVEGNSIQDTGGPGKGHGQIMLWSGKGPVSDVTIRDNEVRDSKRDDLAVVISGKTNDITLEGNQVDGEITRRGGGSFDGSGNTTNDPQMANAAPVPAGMPIQVADNGTNDGGSGTPAPQPPLTSRDDVSRVALPDNSQRQAEANAAAGGLAAARQTLTQATATRLPSLSMDELHQRISEMNNANCN
jgi:hypothetical protein